MGRKLALPYNAQKIRYESYEQFTLLADRRVSATLRAHESNTLKTVTTFTLTAVRTARSALDVNSPLLLSDGKNERPSITISLQRQLAVATNPNVTEPDDSNPCRVILKLD